VSDTRAEKVAIATACLVLGLVVGLSTVALHQRWWGLLLALPATAAEAYALPSGWWARMSFAFGWVAIVGYLALPPDEGGFVIAGDVQGYALLAFGVALLMAAMVTLGPIRRGSAESDHAPS
jgi:hypothetical protein